MGCYIEVDKLYEFLELMPTLDDPVEVVRCEDCEHFDIDDPALQDFRCKRHDIYIYPKDFCSYGEWKESELSHLGMAAWRDKAIAIEKLLFGKNPAKEARGEIELWRCTKLPGKEHDNEERG